MANDKIGNDKLFSDDVLIKTIKEGEILISVLSEIEKKLKDVLEISLKQAKSKPLDGYEDVESVTKAIDDQSKAIQGLTKIEQQQLKLEEKLAQLKKGELDTVIELREAIKAESKALRDSAKERAGLLSKYQKESKRLNELRKEYKDLALEQGKNSKAAKNLLKQITPLDEKLKDIDKTVGQNQREVGNYTKATKGLSRAFKALAASTGVILILNKLSEAFSATAEGSGTLEKGISRITIPLALFVSKLIDAVQVSNSFVSIFGNLKKGLKGFTEEVNKSLEINDKAIEQQVQLTKLEIQREKQIANLNLTQRRQILFSDDNTKSLERQRKETGALNETNNKIFDIQIANAKGRLQVANQSLAADTKNLSKQKEQSAAFTALKELEADKEIARLEALRREREIDRDNDELDLDQLIDISDRRKTVFENISRDETKSFEERRTALDKANNDIEQSFRKQVEVFERVLPDGLPIDELINEEDTVKLNERIKALGLDEIRQNRLREVIQERIQAIRDLEEANTELSRSEEEANQVREDSILIEQALIEIEKEGADLSQILLRLSDQRLQTEIDNIRLRLATVKKGSEEEIKLQKELNEKLLEQQEAKNEKENDLNEKAQAKREEINDIAISGARALNDKLQDSTLSRVDAEIAAVERRQAALQEVAAKGDQTAKENIALEDKRRAELELKRERAIKRQQRIELGLAVLETYSNKVSSGDENALGSTITDTGVLLSFINSLPTFWTGSERVGDDLSPTIQGRDGHVVRVDGDERIVPGHLNKMIGGISNIELATLAHLNRKPTAKQSAMVEPMLIDELRGVKSAIENKPVHSFRYDDARRATIDSVESKRKLVNHIRKNRIL